MSKVTFRARALDATRPMPVYKSQELPDVRDFASINRSVPQMPTGMEKEEETEHHLQRALSAQQVYGSAETLVIPIPEVDDIQERYDKLYTDDFKTTKQYIHVQAFGMDQEVPDYDMDSEDENWLNEQAKKMEITPSKFEEMLDRLEKGSGQQVVTLREAKLLLKEDDDLIIAVYDYWLNKRLRTQHPLIMTVKTEKRDGSTSNNPYVAFRRRTEKMQTRKNRKNDETSYEKMLKLRRDLGRAVTLLEFIKRREKTKKEMLQLTIEVAEKRYKLEDYEGKMLTEAESIRHKLPAYISPYTYKDWGTGEEVTVHKKKREYRKRKHKASVTTREVNQNVNAQPLYTNDIGMLPPEIFSSDEEPFSPMSPSDHEDENDPDGIFAFRRKKDCQYYTPILDRLGNWPWCSPEDGGFGDKKYRYSLTSLSQPQRCIGFARRRIGRGGRVIIDRASTPWDDGLSQADLSGSGLYSGTVGDYISYIKERKIQHYRPHSPTSEDSNHYSCSSFSNSQDTTEFNMESFQSHREQLLQMQREQQEQLLRQQTSDLDTSFNGLEHSFTSQPSSRFTLDTASAKFAVSAVMNSSQLQQQHSATSTSSVNGANSILTSSVSLTNGPITSSSSDSKLPGLSTSPAANILQLNFPLNSGQQHLTAASLLALTSSTSSVASSPVTSLLTTSSASTVLTTINSLTNKNINSISAASLFKLASSHSPTIESAIKQNHEDGKQLNNLNCDTVVAMDVT